MHDRPVTSPSAPPQSADAAAPQAIDALIARWRHAGCTLTPRARVQAALDATKKLGMLAQEDGTYWLQGVTELLRVLKCIYKKLAFTN